MRLTSKGDGFLKHSLCWNVGDDDGLVVIDTADERIAFNASVSHWHVNYVVACSSKNSSIYTALTDVAALSLCSKCTAERSPRAKLTVTAAYHPVYDSCHLTI